jgi:hypothetical protein
MNARLIVFMFPASSPPWRPRGDFPRSSLIVQQALPSQEELNQI